MDKKATPNDIVITESGLYAKLGSLYCGYTVQHTSCTQIYTLIKNNLSVFFCSSVNSNVLLILLNISINV